MITHAEIHLKKIKNLKRQVFVDWTIVYFNSLLKKKKKQNNNKPCCSGFYLGIHGSNRVSKPSV